MSCQTQVKMSPARATIFMPGGRWAGFMQYSNPDQSTVSGPGQGYRSKSSQVVMMPLPSVPHCISRWPTP